MVEFILFAIIPIIPLYSDQLDLSKVQAGALLSASALAVTVSAIPAGVLADRVGARRVTIAAAFLLTISAVLQAVAGSFETVMAARMLFGVASAFVWTAGLSWLSDLSTEKSRAAALGFTVAVAGMGNLAGPVLVGYVAERSSIETAFLGYSVFAGLVAVWLCFIPAGIPHAVDTVSLRRTVRVMTRSRVITGAVLMMLVVGFVDGVVNLLAPLELAADGFSSGPIGLVFSVAAAIFIVVSTAVSRGGWAASSRAAGWACLGQAVTLVPVMFSLTSAAVVLMVLARGPASAVVYTVALPIAVIAARQYGLGTATITGVTMMSWGVASVIGSPVAGLIADTLGDATAYGLSAALLAGVGVWLLWAVPDPQSDPEPAPSPL